MRHRAYGKHLGRNKNERQALFKGLVHSLFSHGTIETSESKAKAIKGLVDKIINSVKKDSFPSDKDLKEKIKEILPKLGNKTSGYTSTIRIGTRLGDQTTMVKMSLIGAEEIKPLKKKLKESKPKVKKAEPVKKETAPAKKRKVIKK